MSTRALVGVGDTRAEKFLGLYVHSDGYPAGLGPDFWRDCQEKGAEGIRAMIAQHPGGWSSYGEKCYCHDLYFAKRDGSAAQDSPYYREDAPNGVWENGGAHSDHNDLAYTYMLDETAKALVIAKHESRWIQKGLMGPWPVICVARLDGPEPDWKALDTI